MGLDPAEVRAHCLDFDLSCMWFGRWTDERSRATVEKPVSSRERRRQVKHVPKYTTRKQILGLATAEDEQKARAEAREEERPPEFEQKLDELRKNPQALVEFLRISGEG